MVESDIVKRGSANRNSGALVKRQVGDSRINFRTANNVTQLEDELLKVEFGSNKQRLNNTSFITDFISNSFTRSPLSSSLAKFFHSLEEPLQEIFNDSFNLSFQFLRKSTIPNNLFQQRLLIAP
jgi:hypothetical protein